MEFKSIPVTPDKGAFRTTKMVTAVDIDVYDDVMKALGYGRRSLRVARNGYAYWHTEIKCQREKHYLHRWIMRAPRGMDVDHVNGDRLNNRKENLQICTRGQNMMKSKKRKGTKSQFRGVSWCSSKNRWQVQVSINGKAKYIGRFKSEFDAARVWDKAALHYYGGHYARPNFPDES